MFCLSRFDLITVIIFIEYKLNVKGKAIPVTGRESP
jgi:hypothetical protein